MFILQDITWGINKRSKFSLCTSTKDLKTDLYKGTDRTRPTDRPTRPFVDALKLANQFEVLKGDLALILGNLAPNIRKNGLMSIFQMHVVTTEFGQLFSKK